MEDLGSFFYAEESVDALKLKLLHTKLKLTSIKNFTMQLLNLLHHVSEDRDRIRHQLHTLQSMMASMDPESFLPTPSKTTNNTSIRESTSHSHISSPVDPFLESVSSSEFSNINVNVDDNNNVGFVIGRPRVHIQTPDLVIQSLAEGKVLPEKGKLLESVMEAGPLLLTLLVAGPLPTWRIPPPPQPINVVPPFAIKLDPSVADPEGVWRSDSMVGFAGNLSGPWNNAQRFIPSASVEDEVPASKRQRI